jgi:hypothetical protein
LDLLEISEHLAGPAGTVCWRSYLSDKSNDITIRIAVNTIIVPCEMFVAGFERPDSGFAATIGA